MRRPQPASWDVWARWVKGSPRPAPWQPSGQRLPPPLLLLRPHVEGPVRERRIRARVMNGNLR